MCGGMWVSFRVCYVIWVCELVSSREITSAEILIRVCCFFLCFDTFNTFFAGWNSFFVGEVCEGRHVFTTSGKGGSFFQGREVGGGGAVAERWVALMWAAGLAVL